MPFRRTSACLALALVAAVLPAGASAFDLGPGVTPDVAVEPGGRAHVTWATTTTSPDTIEYCRLAYRATTCEVRLTLANPKGADGRPWLFRRARDGVLFVLQPVFDVNSGDPDPNSLWLHVSADGGTNWQPPVKVSAGVPDPDDARLTADGNAIDVIADSPHRALFQRMGLGGPPTTAAIDLGAPVRGNYISVDLTLVSPADGRPVVTMNKGSDRWGYRRFIGTNLYDQASWSAFSAPRGQRDRGGTLKAATGRGGTWVLAKEHVTFQAGGAAPFVLRRLGARGFRRGRPAGAGTKASQFIGFTQNITGGLQIVWDDYTGGRSRLRYARTRGDCWFGRPTALFTSPAFAQNPVNVRLSAVNALRGMVVWRGNNHEVVRAAWLRGGDKPVPRLRRGILSCRGAQARTPA